MTHVHYKFSSKLNYNTVVFDGPNITLSELKRLIMTREKLRANDCDLQITNAQNKEEYTDDESPIPKGASVIVRRVPSSGVRSSSSAKNIVRSDASKYSFGAFRPPMDDQKTTGVLPFFSKMANLANVDVSEEDKIKVMMNQSCYDNTNYKRHGAALPANYTCYRCGSMGHHIRNCPVSSDKNAEPSLKIKKSTGIPRSFMVEVNDPTIKGAMLTNTGLYAIPAIDAEAYAVGKKKSSPQEQQTKEPADNPIPDELLCLICHDLLSDAVVIPCCGNSYCDDCIRSALLDSEDHVCPTCNQSDVSPDTLIANKFLRQAVNTFKKEQVHTQSFNKTPSTSQSQNSTPRPSPPTPPPVHSQSQPQKLQAVDTPTITGSDSTPSGPSTSLVAVKSHDEPPDKETEVKTSIAPAAAAPPAVQVSKADPTETHSQPIPLVNSVQQTAVADTSNSGSSSQSGQTPSWDKSTSAAPSEGWTSLSTHHPTSSSTTYSPTQSPGITHSHIQTYLAVQQQQPLSSYPPGYSTTTPPWTPGPSPLRTPIPSFVSSSIPAPVPIEWFMYHRRNKERTPHRESLYGSSSRSYKSKSLRSSSRSPSHSRSQSRSRPHSPHSSHRGLSSRSHSSHSYSYGYKRSPTPSSSSSPRSHHHSSSKSPSDHRKNCHHSQHHSRKSTSSSSSSRRKGERSYTSGSSQGKGPEWSLYTYQRWKQDYKEWCDKYFNSYVNHFQQLPPPLLAPPPQQHWPSHHTTGHSSPSSNSSPPSQSSSESSSTPSQMSSDSRSTPSTSLSNSHSTPAESSSESSGPSQESSKVSQHRNVEKTLSKEREGKRHNNENCNVLKPASKTTDKHLKSKGNNRKRKEPKILDKKKEIKRREEEKRHKVKASQEAGSINANRSRQVGRTRSQHSRSDKNRTRKNEETQRNQRGNIFTEPSPSLETDISPKVFRREKQKKAVWKPQPITEEDVWEGGVKVKPQKRISININMDVKKNVETTDKQDTEAKSNEAIQDFEEKLHSQTDNDMNKKESELEENNPEEMKDEKNDSWEIFAQDEAVGGEDSLLWQCALTGVEEEGIKAGEEESVRVKEEKVDSQEQGKSTFELQSSRDHNERRNTGLDHISSEVGRWQSVSGEEQQKSMTGITCLEYMESRSLEKHKELVQVSHSRYEREVFEPEEQAKVSTNYREKEREPKRMRLVEKEKDEKIENSADRSVVPSSGKEITDRTFDFDRKGRKMTERERDGERESRKQHKSNWEERGCQKERESHSTLYRKYSSGPSQAFTSIVEAGTKSRDRNQEEDKSREKHTRQSKINIDMEWRGKTQEYNHHTSHKDPTLDQYSSWTSLSSHPQDSPGWTGQNWTDRGQRPATPTAESSLGMTSDTENTKQRAIDDRREERVAKVRELDRQTRDEKGQADPERLCCSSGIGSSTSLHDGMNEQRRDKKKQKSHKREKRHSIDDGMKKSRKKNKDGGQQ